MLSYNLKGNGLSGSYVFDLLESSNGTDFIVTQNITSGIGTANTIFQKTLLSTTRYIRWRYTTKATGNIGFGGVNITAVPNQAPTASSVAIAGTQTSGSVLTGSYTYADAESNPQGTSTFKWYRADDASGTNSAAISGATSTTYTLTPTDIGKFIKFTVVPVASAGTTTGIETSSAWTGAIGAGSTPLLNIATTNALTEANLTTELITLTLTNDTFADATLDAANFVLNNAPTGVTVTSVAYSSSTVAQLSLAYNNADFDSNITNFNISINAAELTSASNLTATNILSVTALTETLTTTGTLAFGTLCSNVTPSKLSFVISGSNAKAGTISLAALSGYTFSETENGTYTSTLSVAQTSGTVNKTIWVTFSPTLAQTYNGNIVISGVGAPNTNKAITGTGRIPVAGVVTTAAASAVASTSATLNGNITTLAVCPVISEKGFVYCLTSASNNPVIGDAFASAVSTTSSITTGNYTLNVTLLTQGTAYTYRAYIYNGTDYVYGTAQSFTTTTPPANDLCENAQLINANGNSISGSMVFSTVSFTTSAFGDVWYKFIPNCSGTHVISSTNNGMDLNLYIKDNSCFTSSGDYLGTTNNTTSTSTETLSYGLISGTTYYLRIAYFSGTSNTFSFIITPPSPATAVVATSAATFVTSSAATLNGAVTTLGVCPTSTERGFVYALNAVNNNPEIAGTGTTQVLETAALAANSFNENRTGLTSETTYSYKAYIKNEDNSYIYGTVQTFTTPATTPTTAASAITFGTSTINTITVSNITNGNGANRIMVVRPTTTTRVSPTNGTTYTATSLSFTDTSNATTGTDNRVVFNGTTITNQTITDLAINTNYTVDVYEYNGTGATTAYYYAASASASKATLNLVAPVAIAAESVTTNSFTAKWNTVAGATSYQLDVYTGNPSTTPWINEFHYDNAGTDSNEFVEIVVPSGYTGSDLTLSLYNGGNGASYASYNVNLMTLGTSNSNYSIYTYTTALDGIQNGSPDGFSISDANGLIEFISYEGSFMAADGPAIGITSTVCDINETNTTLANSSIELQGANNSYTWVGNSGLNTKGLINANQTINLGTYVIENQNVGAVTSFIVSGLDDETTYNYRVRAVNGAVVSVNSNIINVTTETASTIWQSTNGGEWSNGAPTTIIDGIIDFPYNTITNPIVAENLTITPNGTLTVSATNPVIIHGNLINNNPTSGAVTVENGGAIIQPNNTTVNGNIGNIVYNRTSPLTVTSSDYVYWSAPVTGQTLSGGQNYVWNNAAGTTGGWATATTMNAGQGVIMRGVGSRAFTGVPFNGDVTVNVSRRAIVGLDDNWNLIGNPYPSAINAIEFLTDVDNTNIEGEVALWTHNSQLSAGNASPFYTNYTYNYSPDDYIYYNALGGQTGPGGFGGNIAAGQAFFVKMIDGATASSSTVKFKNSMRTNAGGAGYNNAQFYRTATTASTTTEEKHRIWLDLVNANAQSSRIVVGYAANATNEKDRMYDASTSFSSTKMRMYSLIEDTKIAIQGRALPFNTNDLVPLGFNAPQTGNFVIAIHAVDGLFENQDIYLEDTQLNTAHDLKQAPYTFNVTTTGENNTRFKVRYTSSTLGNGDFDHTNEVLIVSKNELKAIATAEQIASIAVFDLLGRSIFAKTNINATEFTIPIERVQAPLFVKIKLSNGVVINKKVVY